MERTVPLTRPARACRWTVPLNYPVFGRDAFRTATGVHAAAVIKSYKKGDKRLADIVYSGVPAGEFGLEQVIDIGPMSGLTRLETLRVYNNPISDIGAMRGLTSLHELHVHDLPDLETLQPLVDNPGLEPDDIVYIYGSNASCSDVRALRDKGLSGRE